MLLIVILPVYASITYSGTGNSISSASGGKYYCFKVTDKAGNIGYGEILVDLTAPVITITQDQDSLDATATAAGSTVDTSTWAHSSAVRDSSPTCSSDTYSSAGSTEDEFTITSTHNNKWLCFKVKNAKGVPGYAKAKIDYNDPVVTITQDNDTLTATATDVGLGLPTSPTWKYSGALLIVTDKAGNTTVQ